MSAKSLLAKSLNNSKATGAKERAAALEKSSRDASKYPRCLNPASDKICPSPQGLSIYYLLTLLGSGTTFLEDPYSNIPSE